MRRKRSQPFGQRSCQALSSMVAQRPVTVTGGETDRYGRLQGSVRPDYAVLESEARRQSAGLWSEPGQTEPWRWRSLPQNG
ncbi:thermonuclease family protein [Enterobacter sp. MALB-1]|uniref:thermonuclease family protein n=1 Tax=Enterobacter sp. MALB-1 TaxID=3153561 RepID=UPI0034DB1FF0